jgi:ribosomal protein S18 acetylase RimI-like enzyme
MIDPFEDTRAHAARPAVACALRRATPADALVLCVFAARTFSDTYGRHNHPDNLQTHLDASFNVNAQTAEVTDPRVATLLAHVGGRLAGYAQVRLGPSPECVTGTAAVELHRFYVDGIWHGRGISQQLMAGVRAAAAEFAGRSLWLKVWENNARALAFYAKGGFVDVGSADFFVGPDRQRDRVLVARID